MKKYIALLVSLLLWVPASFAAPSQPNILLFLVDDMGVMDTSVPFLTDADGKPKRYPLNNYYRTPSMERLAKRGIRFNHFYAMSVCSPTRISLLTGQNAARHRSTNWINPRNDNAGPNGPPAWNWRGLKKGDVTLPDILGANGYQTIHIGKAHFGPTDYEGAEPLNLGFDVNIAGAAFGSPGSYYGLKNYGHGTKRDHSAVPHLENYHGTDTFLSEALTIEAKKQVAHAVNSGTPFFLHFAHYAVHSPFESDPRFADHYTDSGKTKAAQAFATLIEGMDKSLGDMLDQLEDLGIAENTLIIFLGDNGSDAPLGHQHAVACAAPLRGKKGAHYEGGMRVPFIAAWGKANSNNPFQKRLPIPEGAVQNKVAKVTDLFPTLLAFTNSNAPDEHTVDGSRLDILLTGKSDRNHKDQFLMHYPHGPHRSNYFTTWRDGDWKVIYHNFPSKGSDNSHYQLYNLAGDPFESTNLAQTEPKQLRRMMQGLIAGLEEHGALYPVDDHGKVLKPELP
ncbi:MAG TPA: N-acetylgalactosamine-6-sulfatase [Verrucomicrobiales bacterium]|jgi:arylsulfatase A-like enzyme|nr:N-acetylgalactosamine-6-sulfatase [Verrucomicrobiales bacterium]HIL71608.1 N-acetylgalactosamine-6-sulfatase [Verrucomicrobiota bacterium]